MAKRTKESLKKKKRLAQCNGDFSRYFLESRNVKRGSHILPKKNIIKKYLKSRDLANFL